MGRLEKISEEKAILILKESEKHLESTLLTRAELERKIGYLLGYVLIWFTAGISLVINNKSTLSFPAICIGVYYTGLAVIVCELMEGFYPADYLFDGNLAGNLSKKHITDQDQVDFILGIARGKDRRSEHNKKKNLEKSSALRLCINILVILTATTGSALLGFKIFFS